LARANADARGGGGLGIAREALIALEFAATYSTVSSRPPLAAALPL